MSPNTSPIAPVAILVIGGGGLGSTIHRASDRALDTVSETQRRFIASISFDSDAGSITTANQFQIGQITNTESGGRDDLSIVQAVVASENGRRKADSVVNRNFGARGDRLTGHRVFADDFASRELSVTAIGREIRKLDAMNPSRIDVLVFGSVAGAIGSSLLPVAPELVEEAARRAGIKSNVRVILYCLSPNLVMTDIRPQYLNENAVATLRDVNASASGYQMPYLLKDTITKIADEIYFGEIIYRSWLLHSNSGAEEAQRAIAASIKEILRTAIDVSAGESGAVLRANFINTIDPESENVFRIVQGQGLYVPARDHADVYTARAVILFQDLVARKKPNGEPHISSDLNELFQQEVAKGDGANKVLFQELHQSSLVAGTDADDRLVPDGSWQHAVAICGADPDRTDVFPLEQAVPLPWSAYLTIDGSVIARFAEELANHHDASIEDAKETFGSMRGRVVAECANRLASLFDRVLNGRGIHADEHNRAALFAELMNLFLTHLQRMLLAWRSTFNSIATTPDGNGGWIDRRKLLTEQIDAELAQLSRSLVARYVPFVGWTGMRRVRNLAAERLDIELLAIAVQILESMTEDLEKKIAVAKEWSGSCAAILDGIDRQARRGLAESETALAVTKTGAAILVGEARLHAALSVVERQEAERLVREVEWSLIDGRVIGRVSTVSLDHCRRGLATPNERNYELTSRSAAAACRQAASLVDVTSCVAEEFGAPDRLLDTLRGCVNPEAEVELDGIKSSAQPAKSIVIAIPRVAAPDAVDFFEELKGVVKDQEKVILTDGAEVRYISALAGIPVQRLRLVCRAGRAYVNSERSLHVSEMLERSRVVSRELHRLRGITWIPPVSIALLLEDPATLRANAIATSTGLLKGAELRTKNGPVSVWSTSARRPSLANPSVEITGMELIRELAREPLRSDLAKVIERFDSQPADRRLDLLTRAAAGLMTETPACLGEDKDLLRLIDIALMAEITRLRRTSAAERIAP